MRHLKKFNDSVFINSHPMKMPVKNGPDPVITDEYLMDEWINKNGTPNTRNEYNKMIDYIKTRRKQIREKAAEDAKNGIVPKEVKKLEPKKEEPKDPKYIPLI